MERLLRPETGAEKAGFFQRIFAALIDGLILALVFFFGVVPNLGWFAPETLLTQAAVSFVYFSLLNSNLGGGATIGKRMMGVRVIDRKGDYLGLPRAMVRAGFDMLPSVLGVYIPMAMPSMLWPVAEIGTAGGTAFAVTNIYLYLFNWRTRQVLHDLVVGSFVVRAETSEQPFEGHTPFGHVAFAVVVVAAIALIGTRMSLFKQAIDGPALCAEPITNAVQSLPFVDRAYVNRAPLSLAKISDPDHTRILAYIHEAASYKEAQTVARKAIAACPALKPERMLRIVLIPRHKGYDLRPRMGIFRSSVEEWRNTISYASRVAPKEGPCTRPILKAVKALSFTSRVGVTQSPLAYPKGHLTQVRVAAPLGKHQPSAMARQVVRKVLAACPSLPDDEVLGVIIVPSPNPPPRHVPQSFDGSVKQWRDRLARDQD